MTLSTIPPCAKGTALPNQPLQPTGTRLQSGAARRGGSRQRLKRSVRLLGEVIR